MEFGIEDVRRNGSTVRGTIQQMGEREKWNQCATAPALGITEAGQELLLPRFAIETRKPCLNSQEEV